MREFDAEDRAENRSEIIPSILLKKLTGLLERRDRLTAEMTQIDDDISSCRTAARLLVDHSVKKDDDPAIHDKLTAFTLQQLEKAYPKSLRSRQIYRAYSEKTGKSVHEKSVGMTLYRLQKEGKALRKGWDWTFVPPSI